MTNSNSQDRSYGFRWMGGGPGAKVPSSKQFSTEAELLEYLDQVNEDLHKGPEGPYDVGGGDDDVGGGDGQGGLAVGDAKVIVYLGDPPEPEPLDSPGSSIGEAVVKGEVDAAVVLHDGEVIDDKLEDPV